jgi:uncharacterized protein (TIGR04255 family)
MRERYRYPPLVELIAELRWGSGDVISPAAAGQRAGGVLLGLSGQHEEFFTRFASKAGTIGFDLVERVIPPGFPALPFQVVYRFRKKGQIEGQEQGTTLYQVGPGVFSANSTPPYRFWDDFEPVLEQGIRLLLESRTPAEKDLPFTGATLRYINAFGAKYTRGQSMPAFVRDILGFAVDLPTTVQEEIPPDREAKPSLQLMIPLKSGQEMNLILTEAIVKSEQALLMDLAVYTQTRTPPIESGVITVFQTAHEVAHRVFVGITKKLSDVMELIEGDET